MRILFIDNDGAGFADYIDIAENTTVEQERKRLIT
jgi:hypothetical protein